MACKYILTIDSKEYSFNTATDAIKFAKDNGIYDETLKAFKPTRRTEDLTAMLRQSNLGEKNFTKPHFLEAQEKHLKMFVNLEKQVQYFTAISAPMSLTKGLNKSFEEGIDRINEQIGMLGIGKDDLDSAVPFDVRYLLTGDPKYPHNEGAYVHKITASNIERMQEVNSLSRTIFMERTPSYLQIANMNLANIKSNIFNDKILAMKDELSAFIQIAAYKNWLKLSDKMTPTLRNSLIYDGTDETSIVDIVREAQKLAPTNTFLHFILPVDTVVRASKKTNKKNVLNRDLLNTIEGRTRGKLEPDMITSMMDSFTELYQTNRFYAEALFDYLIVKDGLMFKNKSFIRMLPTYLFKDMSTATDAATRLLAARSTGELRALMGDLHKQEIYNSNGDQITYFSKEEIDKYREFFTTDNVLAARDAMFRKVFGMSYEDLFSTFNRLYSTDIKNQYNLQYVKLNRPGGASLVSTTKEAGDAYLNISYDPTPEAAEELFAEMLAIGFEEVDDRNFKFKRFVKNRDKEGNNNLYQLVSVTRNGEVYEGDEMTPTGQILAVGNKAKYKLVKPVGASNSTPMANLGRIPTREQMEKNVEKKAGRPLWQNTPKTSAVKAPVVDPLAEQKSIMQKAFSRTGQTDAERLKYVPPTPEAPKPINIYAGTGENADLSNFANRPFQENEDDPKYNNVEAAFQHSKLAFADPITQQPLAVQSANWSTITGAEAKALGKQIKGLNSNEWDSVRVGIMKDFIIASFEQNPEAKAKLLATGDSVLTHTQDKGFWGKEFPKLLMEVREELRNPPADPEVNPTTEPTEPTNGPKYGTFGGLKVRLDYNPEDMPLDFLDDEQADKEEC